jgi:hypothetical protein
MIGASRKDFTRAYDPDPILCWRVRSRRCGDERAFGGGSAGRYLELGVAPGYAFPRASIAAPVKVGLSLADDYELNTGTQVTPVFVDNAFGYFSIALMLTVGMVILGLVTFAAMLAFVKLCDRV